MPLLFFFWVTTIAFYIKATATGFIITNLHLICIQKTFKGMHNTKYNLITVLGPTASGKTAVAAKVASVLDGEVISADSRQVYRGMDLGTGKDYPDYTVDGMPVPYH